MRDTAGALTPDPSPGPPESTRPGRGAPPPGRGMQRISRGDDFQRSGDGVQQATGTSSALLRVHPAFLEEVALGDPVRHVDGQIGEMNGLGWLLRCGLATPADHQLAEAPTREAFVGLEAGEAFRFDESRRETEPRSRLRHRHKAKAVGNS